MSAPRLQIIVVGAGIGGLAAAVMLRSFADVTVSLHALDFWPAPSRASPVQILESAHQLKEIGAAITIGCGAVSILRRFGIDLEKEGGVPVEAIRTWDTEGKVLATTEFHAKERLGEPPVRS
jgi:2-polyprenyl-6-methoxyphenol hydroxylase-like FAD-dependent oxidoreductase